MATGGVGFEDRDDAFLGDESVRAARATIATYLTYLGLAVIDAICQWCVVLALLTLGLLLAERIGVARLLTSGEPPETSEAAAT